jgi:Tfp pilus assembly protein PilO
MTGRDRMVLIGLSVLALLAAAWILVVSPERKQASTLAAQVTAAQTQLSTAEGQLSSARAAQTQYAAAYSSVVSLGKAVPPSQEVPSLIFQLAAATGQKNVEFSSITNGGGSSASTAAATGSAATAFTQMPFTFVFNGSFFDLEHLFHKLDSFASVSSSGAIQVSGRLLTIQSIKLSPVDSAASEQTTSEGKLSGTISASAYELPPGQSVTGATATATPAAPASSAATPTTSSSPPAPAIARVNP